MTSGAPQPAPGRQYVVVGTTDEWDACDCCGRTNLKRYVVMRDVDGEYFRFGTGCAARLEGIPAADVRREARSADEAARAADEAARQERAEAKAQRWFAFLEAAAGPGDTFDQIERLGGYAEAKALYRASVA